MNHVTVRYAETTYVKKMCSITCRGSDCCFDYSWHKNPITKEWRISKKPKSIVALDNIIVWTSSSKIRRLYHESMSLRLIIIRKMPPNTNLKCFLSARGRVTSKVQTISYIISSTIIKIWDELVIVKHVCEAMRTIHHTTPKTYTSYGFLTSYSFYNKP